MTRKTRFHVDSMPESSLAPKHLTKQEFGRRLYKLMMTRAWNQSELARQSNLPRDSISTYIRGIALPTPKSLEALAAALGVQPIDLLPNAMEAAVDEDHPSLEMRVSTSAPNAAWLRVNRLVSLSTAARVIELIEADVISVRERRDAPADAG
jgi:transcriptional regulator with XRE-family HTH domain